VVRKLERVKILKNLKRIPPGLSGEKALLVHNRGGIQENYIQNLKKMQV
jgi:hypothetical protein